MVYAYRNLWTHSDCICLCLWLALGNAMYPLLLLFLRSSRLQFRLYDRLSVCAFVCELFFRIIFKWQRNKGRRNWVKSRTAFLLYFDLRAMQHCPFPLPFCVSLLSVSLASRLSPRATDRYWDRGTDRETMEQTERHTGSLLFSTPYLLTHSQYMYLHTHTLAHIHTQKCVYTVRLCLCMCACLWNWGQDDVEAIKWSQTQTPPRNLIGNERKRRQTRRAKERRGAIERKRQHQRCRNRDGGTRGTLLLHLLLFAFSFPSNANRESKVWAKWACLEHRFVGVCQRQLPLQLPLQWPLQSQ